MSMRRPRHDLGRVDWIGAEAVGLPGERTFRLLVRNRETSGQLWLEKEQLQALATAIAQMVAEISNETSFDMTPSGPATTNEKPSDFPAQPDIEVYVGELTLKYDSSIDLIAIEVLGRDEDPEGPPTFLCTATRTQMLALQANSLEVLAAGRPRCPLCHTPLSAPGMPHFCPPTNGHQKLVGDEED
jgi:uncharacterized repeat protein (TIGR03847 family)